LRGEVYFHAGSDLERTVRSADRHLSAQKLWSYIMYGGIRKAENQNNAILLNDNLATFEFTDSLNQITTLMIRKIGFRVKFTPK